MSGFDIETLLRFTPPEYLCERCFALLPPSPDLRAGRCSACGVAYVPTAEYPRCEDYLASKGLRVRFDNLTEHSRRLARVAWNARRSFAAQTDYPPMRALLEALHEARQFVHFTTFGISALLLGALRLAAYSVPVRGVVSGVRSEPMIRELSEYQDEAPGLALRVYPRESQWFPHQKIIVVDGLLAFKGSANLTDYGWRKAAHGHEVIEVVSDIREVSELNNRYFSTAWAGYEAAREGGQIVMASF